ncbi:uncharacterized protein [Argopecten irradians]|uniref:uncharacterized protein n=1 Tax=Argopecten irradians TaxID=31199 RepID=UPI00371C8C28
MIFSEGSSILCLFILLQLNTSCELQLIGEERKYVFLEQAILERVRSTMFGMLDNLQSKLDHLQENVKRLQEEIAVIKSSTHRTGAASGCPLSDVCTIDGLICPRFHMDPSTLHSLLYLSRDNLTLFNGGQDNTDDLIKGTDQSRVYKGVQGSSPITNTQKVYFEVEIFYRIKQTLDGNDLVFEIGLSKEDSIDERTVIAGQKGTWSIYAATNTNLQNINFEIHSNGSFEQLYELSDVTSGTEINSTLGFYVNRLDRVITVIDINKNSTVYTFTDVDGNQDLWPVFGGYNPHKVSVRLRLNAQKDISSFPCDILG